MAHRPAKAYIKPTANKASRNTAFVSSTMHWHRCLLISRIDKQACTQHVAAPKHLLPADAYKLRALLHHVLQVGYFDDPLPGAAHFLEHMVHMGSTPYPDDKEYKAFLAAHGGSSNASTGDNSMQDFPAHRYTPTSSGAWLHCDHHTPAIAGHIATKPDHSDTQQMLRVLQCQQQ